MQGTELCGFGTKARGTATIVLELNDPPVHLWADTILPVKPSSNTIKSKSALAW